jgi:hypothetical protein
MQFDGRTTMFKRTLIGTCSAAVLTAILLTGCVVTAAVPGPRAYVGATIAVAPPPAPVEYVGAPPAAGYVWIGGYWNWVGGRHVWVAGRWEAGRPGYHWTANRWVQVAGGWRFAAGRWVRG